MSDRSGPDQGVVVRNVEVLSQDRYRVEKYTIDRRTRDGSWCSLAREVHWRGDSAIALLYCSRLRTVVLTRQFRLPVFVNGQSDGMMIEAPGGLLEGETPATCVQREANPRVRTSPASTMLRIESTRPAVAIPLPCWFSGSALICDRATPEKRMPATLNGRP